MKQRNETVCKETRYIALAVALFSGILQAVFLLLGKWGWPVLFGNLLSAAAAIGNFFCMGVTIQHAVQKPQKQAAHLIQLSQWLRLVLLFGAGVLGVLLPCFNTWAVLIPLFFPRIAILFRPLFGRKKKEGKPE